ncbi:hypothetical protein ABZZ74_51770 [Streptomyces sp. NPDC006476]|uniref:hypothetical protein n=1 Tax=Streptomyces sp. NPDC006476 TaxID=3157175 RepID=UPI0033AE0E28
MTVRRTADLARRVLHLGAGRPVTGEGLDALVHRLDGAEEDAPVGQQAARLRLLDLMAALKIPGRPVTYARLVATWQRAAATEQQPAPPAAPQEVEP